MNNIRICHFTIAHRLEDERIFHKECKSLSKIFEVYLVSTGNFTEKYRGINVIGLNGKPKGIFNRFKKIFTIIPILLRTNSKIFHFHDPELIITGLILKMIYRKKVVYDVHEHHQSKISFVLEGALLQGFISSKISDTAWSGIC